MTNNILSDHVFDPIFEMWNENINRWWKDDCISPDVANTLKNEFPVYVGKILQKLAHETNYYILPDQIENEEMLDNIFSLGEFLEKEYKVEE